MLLPLWIGLGVLAVVLVLIAVVCIIYRLKQENRTVNVNNSSVAVSDNVPMSECKEKEKKMSNR